ncbi:MAG: Trm112 family protein [Thermodesulfobacteriota bacterium]
MKKKLIEQLICPSCLPAEYSLSATVEKEFEDDIIHGTLVCPGCKIGYPISDSIAFLLPGSPLPMEDNKYEQDEVVASYMWSHYGDLIEDEMASEAYLNWAAELDETSGLGLDVGGAVGRFTFEMGNRCDLAVGIDNSVAFIRAARQLMKDRSLQVRLKEEGELEREVTFTLPPSFSTERVEFIVGDALRLPFRSRCASIVTSLNLVDKVPLPGQHLRELGRTAMTEQAQLIISDPFSWSTEVAEPEEWLGGREEGIYGGRGLDNIRSILENDDNGSTGGWRVEKSGHTWWKIRTHCNHYEMIRSRYLRAVR